MRGRTVVLRQKHFIDSHKGATALFVLFCMWRYDAWQSATAWVYLALHGGYGLLWIAKSAFFGDKQWEKPTSLGYGFVIWGALSLYWTAPWIITAHDVTAPPWLLGVAVFTYVVGVFLHFAGDMQKHVSLALRPGELFTDGLWSFSRNPNYLGELLIYAGFTSLALHWLPPTALAAMVLAVWVPNMVRKDRSLRRYPSFVAWQRRSGLMFPFWP